MLQWQRLWRRGPDCIPDPPAFSPASEDLVITARSPTSLKQPPALPEEAALPGAGGGGACQPCLVVTQALHPEGPHKWLLWDLVLVAVLHLQAFA